MLKKNDLLFFDFEMLGNLEFVLYMTIGSISYNSAFHLVDRSNIITVS